MSNIKRETIQDDYVVYLQSYDDNIIITKKLFRYERINQEPGSLKR